MQWDKYLIAVMVILLVCLAFGFYAIWPKNAKKHPWVFSAFFWSIFFLLIWVVPIQIWEKLDTDQKFLFCGLTGLAFYVYMRVNKAKVKIDTNPGKYIDDIGFAQTVLGCGIVVAALFYLKAPDLLIFLAGIAFVAFMGRMLIEAVKTEASVKKLTKK